MRINANMTVYNKYVDATTTPPSDKYLLTQIIGVAWENRKASNVLASGGSVLVDQAMVYIPKIRDAAFKDSREWQALSTANKANYWTLQKGDYIVRGAVSDVISSSFTISDLKRKYNDVLIVSTIDLMDNGSRNLQHWKVSAG